MLIYTVWWDERVYVFGDWIAIFKDVTYIIHFLRQLAIVTDFDRHFFCGDVVEGMEDVGCHFREAWRR